jgi:putative ABC transport system permease protein
VLVKAQSHPLRLRAPVAAAVASLDSNQPLYNARTMPGAQGTARPSTYLLGAFSLLALAIAAVGIYGVIAYAAGERTREIGIRIVLGARPGPVVRAFVRRGTRLVAAGRLLGLDAAFALSQVARSPL